MSDLVFDLCARLWRCNPEDFSALRYGPESEIYTKEWYAKHDPPPQESGIEDAGEDAAEDSTEVAPNQRILRPGTTVTSSTHNGPIIYSSLGVRVVDEHGRSFVTVSVSGFHSDGLVWHDDPTRTIIGKVIHNIPNTDLAIARLVPEMRFENVISITTTTTRPLTSIANSPRPNGTISLTNQAHGTIRGHIMTHFFNLFKSSGHNVDMYWSLLNTKHDADLSGSAGTPIVHESSGDVLGFFEYKSMVSRDCDFTDAGILAKLGFSLAVDEATAEDGNDAMEIVEEAITPQGDDVMDIEEDYVMV